MKKRRFHFLCVLCLLFACLFLTGQAGASNTDYQFLYTFADRHGVTRTALEDAFATRVVSFAPGDPWTEYEANQDPELTLGLPDAANDKGDLTLGTNGVLVVELGLPVRDADGADLYVFETGGSVEELRVEVSDDLSQWYDAGTLSGSTAEADLEGRVPAGQSFRYVRLTDAGNGGNPWPGADIDALCTLNAVSDESVPAVYRFRDRQKVWRGAAVSDFAVRVVSFTHGDPWTGYPENQSPEAALGLPDYTESGGRSTGDLNLGAGGSVVLEFDTPLRDGPGADLYVFEAGPGGAEETKVEVSADLQTWYNAGSISDTQCQVDLAGAVSAGEAFRYLRLTDLSMSGSEWPGADIDAVCGLHQTPEYVHFADEKGVPHSTPANAFAARVVDFVPGSPWTRYANDRKVENTLGAPDYDGNDGELTLGGGGVVTLGFDVELCDGPGLDIFVFEIADDVERTRIEVSRDLLNWYEVGISEGSFAGVDIAGMVPEGYSFSYVRLTDLRDHTESSYPGADIDAVCGLHIQQEKGTAYPYRINSILAQNDAALLTEEEMTVEVSVTKTAAAGEAVVFLAAYDRVGRLMGSLSATETGEQSAGETLTVEFPVDNRGGAIKTLKAFVLGNDSVMTLLSCAFVYPSVYPDSP